MSGSGKKGKKKREREREMISQLTIQQNSQASLPLLGVEHILKKQNRSFLLPGISRPEGGAGQFQQVQDLPRAWGGRNAWTDGKVFQFLDAKCELTFLSKRNPRQTNWTVLYRSKHRNGQSEDVRKKRTCYALKFQRADTGASLADVTAKRKSEPEPRKAQ